MDKDRQEQHNRLNEPKRSMASKIAWKKHHSNYMNGIRKRERNKMNKTFYGMSKQLEEILESSIDKDNVFDLNCIVSFDNIAGGISFNINKEDGMISISANLVEEGSGNYKLKNTPTEETAYENLYEDLKSDIKALCDNFDSEMKLILNKHGLNSTK